MNGSARIRGQVAAKATAPLTFAVRGSLAGPEKGRPWQTGWGYVSNAGSFGVGFTPYPRWQSPRHLAFVSELEAAWRAINSRLPHQQIRVLVHSSAAQTAIQTWRSRRWLPDGYLGDKATLLDHFADLVRHHGGNLTVAVANADVDVPLPEIAETLARLGRRWRRDELAASDVSERASAVVEGFLAAVKT